VVRKLAGRGWKMIRTPQHISIRELSDVFLINVNTLPSQASDAEIHAWFKLALQNLQALNDKNVQSLIAK
jgi:hypothetical protein